MKKPGAALVALVMLALVAAACEKAEKVGSEELLKKVKEEEQAERLGEILRSPAPKAGSSPGAIQNPPPETARTPTPPAQQQQTVEIALVGSSPYYQPGPHIRVTSGTLIKVINKDEKTRQFLTVDGPYDSGNLDPGGTFEFTASVKGKFKLEDPNAPFIQGIFEVL